MAPLHAAQWQAVARCVTSSGSKGYKM